MNGQMNKKKVRNSFNKMIHEKENSCLWFTSKIMLQHLTKIKKMLQFTCASNPKDDGLN